MVVSPLVFGLAHFEQPQGPVFVLTWILAGVVFGLVDIFSGHLALVSGGHAMFNITANVVPGFQWSSGPMSSARSMSQHSPASSST